MSQNKFIKSIKQIGFNIKHTVESCYLCMRFPFLYPRNRFSGMHYTNWTINGWVQELYNKSHKNGTSENNFESIVINHPLAVLCKVLAWIHHYPIQWLHFIPTYTELDSMDAGWRKTFGVAMCQEIKDALLRDGGRKLLYSYRIMQIKEKYGTLRWYDCNSTHDVHRIIDKYEYVSARTCIVCGRPAIGMTNGWIEPYCEDCAKKNGYDINDTDCFDKYGTEKNTWYGYCTAN
jgi:hypothetical protein